MKIPLDDDSPIAQAVARLMNEARALVAEVVERNGPDTTALLDEALSSGAIRLELVVEPFREPAKCIARLIPNTPKRPVEMFKLESVTASSAWVHGSNRSIQGGAPHEHPVRESPLPIQ